MSVFRPVAVEADRAIAAGAIVWRYRDALHLTAIVKATFAIVPDGPLALTAPEDLHADDVRLGGEGAVVRPSDHVPYRARADVVVRAGWRAPVGRARVALHGAAGFEKVLAPHDDPASIGPTARAWPAAAAVLDLPADFDVARFQIAPADQRTAYLHGDEWIVIEGLVPARPVLSTKLPDAHAAGVFHRLAAGAPVWSQPIALHADTLFIDLAQQRCVVSWRLSMPLSAGDALHAIRLDLGLHVGGRAVESAPPPRRVTPKPMEMTIALDAPIEPAPRAAPPRADFNATLELTTNEGAPAPLPFPVAAPPAPARVAPIEGAPWSPAAAARAPTPKAEMERTVALGGDLTPPPAPAPWVALRAAPAPPTPKADMEHTIAIRGDLPAPAPPPRPPLIASPAPATTPPAPSPPASSPASAPRSAPESRDPRELFRRLPKKKA